MTRSVGISCFPR